MTRIRQFSVLIVIGMVSFAATLIAGRKVPERPRQSARNAALAATAPESVQLAAMGIRPGQQLVAYILGSSRCRSCRDPGTKAAFAAVKPLLQRESGGRYRSVRVAGIAINTDMGEGLRYLESIGLESFDELSTGSGWRNEHVIRLAQLANRDAEVPAVVVITRTMTARLNPLSVRYGPDSVIAVIVGQQALLDWIRGGANLSSARPRPPAPVRSGSE